MHRLCQHACRSGQGIICTLLLGVTMVSCSPYRVVNIPSSNQSERIDYVVIHFTSETFADSMRLLTKPSDNPVSTHYLIPESADETYFRSAPVIHQLVEEPKRAWHAGVSYWDGADSLNDRSIGIELVNTSRCTIEEADAEALESIGAICRFEPFDERQLELLVHLLKDILERYPGIDPVDVVGHSDIAPERKMDPGPQFPWRRLHELGIGAWFDAPTRERYARRFEISPPDTLALQAALAAYGYNLTPNGEWNAGARKVVRAFQMHFTPEHVTGEPDAATASAVFALLEKYKPDSLEQILEQFPERSGSD